MGKYNLYLFHALAEKVNSEKFNEIKPSIVYLYKMSITLSCCSNHALQNLKKSNLNLLNSKADLIEF